MGKPTLVVIEGKGKVKSVQGYLGSNYLVVASSGHFYDLKKSGISIHPDDDFRADYEYTKPEVAREIKDAYKRCSGVLLAGDADREGAWISYSVGHLLGVDMSKPCRIIFTEVSKQALQNAVKNPVELDMNIIGAQQTRRKLDRLVGYMLSNIVMSAIPGCMSAGRVQSVVQKMIVEAQQKRDKFFEDGSDSFFRVRAEFNVKQHKLKTTLYELKSRVEEVEEVDEDEDEVVAESGSEDRGKRQVAQVAKNEKSTKIIDRFVECCKKSEWKVDAIRHLDSVRNPAPPFQTSSATSTAASVLGMSVKRCTSTLQSLYTKGHVSYIRTDSIVLPGTVTDQAGKIVKDQFGKEYHKKRVFTNKADPNAQEAHTAIYPIKMEVEELSDGTDDEKRLYSLIWKRTVASQAEAARFKVAEVDISGSKLDDRYVFMSRAEKCIFPGFLAIYNFKGVSENGEEDATELKKDIDFKKGSKCTRLDVECKQSFSNPPPMYSEATLVKQMKKFSIARPATTGPTIEKLLSRGYSVIDDLDGEKMDCLTIVLRENDKVAKEASEVYVGREKKKIIPTSMGTKLVVFLDEKFPKIMDYQFTADMEKTLDLVAAGKKKQVAVLRKFYDWFEPEVTELKKKIKEEKAARGDAPQYERIVGKMDDGREIYARTTRTGPAVFIIEEDGKIKYGDLGRTKIEKVTEAQARKLLSIPKVLGEYKGEEVVLKKGPYGFYVVRGELKAPVPKDEDPFELELDRAVELLKVAKKVRGERYLKEFEDSENAYAVMRAKPKNDDDTTPRYFVMIKPKPKVLSDEEKKEQKRAKKKMTAEEKQKEKEAKEREKARAARGKKGKSGGVEFVGIGDRDPMSITPEVVRELLREKAERGPPHRGKKGTSKKSNDGTEGEQKGGRRRKTNVSGRGGGYGIKARSERPSGKPSKKSNTRKSATKKNTKKKPAAKSRKAAKHRY